MNLLLILRNKDAWFNTRPNTLLKSADSIDEALKENIYDDPIDYESYFEFEYKQ